MGEGAIPGPPGIYLFRNDGIPQSALFNLISSNLIPNVFTQYSLSVATALADIDTDGDLDLFGCDQDQHFYFFLNDGSASNPRFTYISNNWQKIFYAGGPDPQLIPMFFDIDNDGDLDLFCGMAWDWNQLWFYRNEGSPFNPQMNLETQTFLGEGLLHFTGVDIVDIDNDGDGDFLLSTYNGGIVFFRNITGETGVGPKRPIGPPVGKIDLGLGPNPGNPVTCISFSLPSPQEATLAVYNILGARVTTRASGLQPPGEHSFYWNNSQVSSGVYIIRLETVETEVVRKVVVVK